MNNKNDDEKIIENYFIENDIKYDCVKNDPPDFITYENNKKIGIEVRRLDDNEDYIIFKTILKIVDDINKDNNDMKYHNILYIEFSENRRFDSQHIKKSLLKNINNTTNDKEIYDDDNIKIILRPVDSIVDNCAYCIGAINNKQLHKWDDDFFKRLNISIKDKMEKCSGIKKMYDEIHLYLVDHINFNDVINDDDLAKNYHFILKNYFHKIYIYSKTKKYLRQL